MAWSSSPVRGDGVVHGLHVLLLYQRRFAVVDRVISTTACATIVIAVAIATGTARFHAVPRSAVGVIVCVVRLVHAPSPARDHDGGARVRSLHLSLIHI